MDRKHIITLLCLSTILLVLLAGCTTNSPSDRKSSDNASGKISAAGSDIIIVGIDGQYTPFSMMDEKGNVIGFDVESLKWIAKDQGFTPEFQTIAWDGIIPALQAKKIDMVYAGMTITDDRKEKVDFSKPYWRVNQTVVVLNSSPVTLDQIKTGKAVIGTQRGCTAAIWVEDNLVNKTLMPETNLKQYENTPLALSDLISGRIDAVIYDSTVINEMIEDKPIKKLGTIETDEQFGIAVRKGDTELLNKLNTGLDHLMQSPDWKDLIKKYKLE